MQAKLASATAMLRIKEHREKNDEIIESFHCTEVQLKAFEDELIWNEKS